MNIDRNASVRIPCPQCGQKTEQTVANLEFSPRLRCPVCGASFAVNYRKLLEKLKQAEAQAELERRRSGN
jgi:transposase-like protein